MVAKLKIRHVLQSKLMEERERERERIEYFLEDLEVSS